MTLAWCKPKAWRWKAPLLIAQENVTQQCLMYVSIPTAPPQLTSKVTRCWGGQGCEVLVSSMSTKRQFGDFSWAYTMLWVSYGLERPFTIGTSIKVSNSLTWTLCSQQHLVLCILLPPSSCKQHKTHSVSKAVLRQQLRCRFFSLPVSEGSLLPQKPQLLQKGIVSAASCGGSEQWKYVAIWVKSISEVPHAGNNQQNLLTHK